MEFLLSSDALSFQPATSLRSVPAGAVLLGRSLWVISAITVSAVI